MELTEKLAKMFSGAPIPLVVLVFGGFFVVTSITADEYIFESFLTFIYGALSSFVRIVRKDEQMGYWVYFIFQGILFSIWAYTLWIRLY